MVGSIAMEAFNQLTGGSFLLGAVASSNGQDNNGNKSAATTSLGGLMTMLERLLRITHVIFDCHNNEAVAKYQELWLRAGVDDF